MDFVTFAAVIFLLRHNLSRATTTVTAQILLFEYIPQPPNLRLANSMLPFWDEICLHFYYRLISFRLTQLVSFKTANSLIFSCIFLSWQVKVHHQLLRPADPQFQRRACKQSSGKHSFKHPLRSPLHSLLKVNLHLHWSSRSRGQKASLRKVRISYLHLP